MLEATYALITGASSGMGACFAQSLAARGHHLILVARSQDKLATLAAELPAHHSVQAEPLAIDLCQPGAAERLAQRLREQNVTIDLLVNNAGFGARGEFWHVPLERQMQMINLNILAVVELTHRRLGHMVERRRGAVINVSSTASFQPVPYTSVYAASKAFLTSFSMALAEEVRPYGIQVVTLCLGGTATGFFQAGGYEHPRVFGKLQKSEEVVNAALNALDRGRGLVLSRYLDKISLAAQRLAPRQLVARIAGRIYRPDSLAG